MQSLKKNFEESKGGTHGSVQTCIRTNDIDLIGDGIHLSSFEMIGNFSFNGIPFYQSCLMWDEILSELDLKKKSVIHIHPDKSEQEKLWKLLGYKYLQDIECKWSDGNVGGYCNEVYIGNLEIGNLVNPMEHSTDVGFGLERILQVIEGTKRVDETSAFDQNLSPIVRDLYRTLLVFKENKIFPGRRGREYVCHRLLRKCVENTNDNLPGLEDWFQEERDRYARILSKISQLMIKHRDKPDIWWWDTHGVSKEDLEAAKLVL